MATGPRTAKGKAASAMNATKHGLTAQRALLPDEDASAYEDLAASVHEELNPRGPIERVLVGAITVKLWRMGRLALAETGVLRWTWYQEQLARAKGDVAHATEPVFDVWPGMELVPLEGKRKAEAKAARARLAAIQALRGEQEEAVGMASQAVHQDAAGSDVLSRLARYETTLERGLYRALRELERLQADRLD